ncbi:hypothetical protein EGW08_005546 [Elysia chlorotica]|uniref:Temptin Cys/Cys disulfide domain-containing protein n=1 Tax=Elysia chlorotica TaxID=188477 RepID=A0A433TYN9_ELYCH|nr:hypothetical protein EGW08_005546 [Elysia chlorotica]
MLKLLALSLCVATVLGLPSYRSRIPNGYAVPSPCDDGLWRGVGHFLDYGSGPLNHFGEAFLLNDFVWDETLCRLDSDKDGVPNGVELGDPDCQWSLVNQTALSPATGHPGICEPVGSAECANSGFTC